jgi:HTH-type transcriptional regulator, sugar sensing transcriptional regulator
MGVDSKILQQLISFGITEYEAKVYVALTQKGPQKASAVALISGIPRPHIYSTLKTLQEKGLIIAIPKNVAEYQARAPGEALSKLLEERKRSVEELEAIGKDLVQKLENKDKAHDVEGDKLLPLNLYQGHWNIINLSREMLGRSKYRCDIMTNDPYDQQFTDRTYEREILDLIKRGIAMRVVIPVISENMPIIENLANIASVRHSNVLETLETPEGKQYSNLRLRVIIIDDSESLFIMLNDADGQEFALHVKQKDLVAITSYFFYYSWNNAPELVKRLDLLEGAPYDRVDPLK